MISRLKDLLAQEKPAFACWSGFRDPQVAGAIARQQYDAVVLDAQHGFHDDGSLLDCIQQVVVAGKSPIVRLPLNRWDLCEKVLDYGALGVAAPMINTKSDAKAFARSANYPSIGQRSYAPRYAATLYGLDTGEYQRKTLTDTFAFAQVETQESYDNLDDILAVDGIDGILMGPSDFSISVNKTLEPDAYGPGTLDLVRDVAERTLSAGKIPTCFTLTAEHANVCAEFGYKLISLTMDSAMIAAGAAKSFEGVKR
jgi:4-hydroxy-2-oxoheptanedioate aldolase